MSNTVNFNIVSGAAPFEAELINSGLPSQTMATIGAYSFLNVELGVYTLSIVDGNGCLFEEEITVNPSVTTTTTTAVVGTSIVIGNTQDPITIFNPDATNRSSDYIGYPDPDVARLFIWFKTLDGQPLVSPVTLSYDIYSPNVTGSAVFTFVGLSDEIHSEVVEDVIGPISPLSGDIILKAGFIETYFEYIYAKGEGAANKQFNIDITSVPNIIYTGIPTRQDVNAWYGVEGASNFFTPNRIFLTYSYID